MFGTQHLALCITTGQHTMYIAGRSLSQGCLAGLLSVQRIRNAWADVVIVNGTLRCLGRAAGAILVRLGARLAVSK